MRVIGGEYRSRLISMPKGAVIRPTQDKVRQAVFNIIGDVSGKSALDLFAGSGAFGIEALSRGAKSVTFVDNEPSCVKAIITNLESLAIPRGSYDIIRYNALNGLRGLGKEARSFDLVFMDPPYRKGIAKMCLINMDACDILTRNALIVVESSKSDELPAGLKTLAPVTERRYGDTAITILRRAA